MHAPKAKKTASTFIFTGSKAKKPSPTSDGQETPQIMPSGGKSGLQTTLETLQRKMGEDYKPSSQFTIGDIVQSKTQEESNNANFPIKSETIGDSVQAKCTNCEQDNKQDLTEKIEEKKSLAKQKGRTPEWLAERVLEWLKDPKLREKLDLIATKEQDEAFLECINERAQKWGNLVAWGVGLATAACVLITTRHPVKGAICQALVLAAFGLVSLHHVNECADEVLSAP